MRLIAVMISSTMHQHPRRKSHRFRKSLQPSRDIDGITEQVVTLHHNVADVDADAEHIC